MKLHRYLEQRFNTVEALIAVKADKTDVESVMNAVDGLYQRLDTVEVELAAVISHGRRIDDLLQRHNDQLHKIGS